MRRDAEAAARRRRCRNRASERPCRAGSGSLGIGVHGRAQSPAGTGTREHQDVGPFPLIDDDVLLDRVVQADSDTGRWPRTGSSCQAGRPAPLRSAGRPAWRRNRQCIDIETGPATGCGSVCGHVGRLFWRGGRCPHNLEPGSSTGPGACPALRQSRRQAAMQCNPFDRIIRRFALSLAASAALLAPVARRVLRRRTIRQRVP